MVGREVQLTVDRGESHPADAALDGRAACTVKDDRGREVVRGVDLEVRAGEILGIAGVAGNGQDELVEALDRPAQADRRDGRRSTARTSPAPTPREMQRARRRATSRPTGIASGSSCASRSPTTSS